MRGRRTVAAGLLAGAMVVSLVACGDDDEVSFSQASENQVDSSDLGTASEAGVEVTGDSECDYYREADVSVSDGRIVIGNGDKQVSVGPGEGGIVVDAGTGRQVRLNDDGLVIEGEGGRIELGQDGVSIEASDGSSVQVDSGECGIDASGVDIEAGQGDAGAGGDAPASPVGASDDDGQVSGGGTVQIMSDRAFTCDGEDVVIGDQSADIVLSGRCNIVNVGGRDHNVDITGSASRVNVGGQSHNVDIAKATSVDIGGQSNNVVVEDAEHVTVGGQRNNYCVKKGSVVESGLNNQNDC